MHVMMAPIHSLLIGMILIPALAMMIRNEDRVFGHVHSKDEAASAAPFQGR